MRNNLQPTLLSLLLLGLCCSVSAQQPEALLKHETTPRISTHATSLTISLPTLVSNARINSAVDSLGEPPLPLSVSSLRPDPASPAAIIKNFIEAEKKFRETLIQFSFRRDVRLQTLSKAGEVTGEYLRNSIFVLDDSGRRMEQVVYHPRSTMKVMKITKEDIQDLAGSQLFGLETEKLHAADVSYNFSFVRKENLNGRPSYVLAVRPRQEPNPNHMRERFFVGQVWIDAHTFQTIKLRGVTEPHGKQRFPVFETERGLQIEDHLFPSETTADDILRFSHTDIRYRIRVRYYEFKRFASRVTIVDVDE